MLNRTILVQITTSTLTNHRPTISHGRANVVYVQ